jgi:hypothetical protein
MNSNIGVDLLSMKMKCAQSPGQLCMDLGHVVMSLHQQNTIVNHSVAPSHDGKKKRSKT